MDSALLAIDTLIPVMKMEPLYFGLLMINFRTNAPTAIPIKSYAGGGL
jgi:hypothetical protein